MTLHKKISNSLAFILTAVLLIFLTPILSAEETIDNYYGPTPMPESLLSNGSASYNIPIIVPPGRNGMQPNLSFNYNSGRRNGPTGLGWDISIGYIQRSTKNGLDYEGDEYISSSAGDLIKESSWGGNAFRAQREGGFTRYYKNGKWEVMTTSGNKMHYGSNDHSRIFEGNRIFKWYLDKVEDTNGNYIEYKYLRHEGNLYIEQINYTLNNNGASAWNSVKFFYDGDRTDKLTKYNSFFPVQLGKKLIRIEVWSDGKVHRTYYPEYEYTSNTKKLVLKTIKRYAYNADGLALPLSPLTFTWNDGSGDAGLEPGVDINGDGYGDKIIKKTQLKSYGGTQYNDKMRHYLEIWYQNTDNNELELTYTIELGEFRKWKKEDHCDKEDDDNSCDWVTAPQPVFRQIYGDLNSDECKDMILIQGCTFRTYVFHENNTYDMHIRDNLCGIVDLEDRDDDGWDDILASTDKGSKYFYFSSYGNGTFSGPIFIPGMSTNKETEYDLNGDGFYDLVEIETTTWSGSSCVNQWINRYIKVYYNDGNDNLTHIKTTGIDNWLAWKKIDDSVECIAPPAYGHGVANIGNDDRAELVYWEIVPQNWPIRIYSFNADGSFSKVTQFIDHDAVILRLEDMNEDGYKDLVAQRGLDNYGYYPANGTGTFGGFIPVADISIGRDRTVDINGDGYKDVITMLWGMSGSARYPHNYLKGLHVYLGDEDVVSPNYTAIGIGLLNGRGTGKRKFVFGDINGDAVADYLYYTNNGHVSYYKVFIFNSDLTYTATEVKNIINWEFIVGFSDQNEDGLSDILTYKQSEKVYYYRPSLGNGQFGTPVNIGKVKSAKDQLVSIQESSNTNEEGDFKYKYTIHYESSEKLREEEEEGLTNQEILDLKEDMPFPVQVVIGIKIENRITGDEIQTTETTYGYKKGYYDQRYRDFRGFEISHQINPDTSMIERTFETRDYWIKGNLKRVRFYSSNEEDNYLLTDASYNYDKYNIINDPDEEKQVKFVKMIKRQTDTYNTEEVFSNEQFASTIEEYTYNNTTGRVIKTEISGSNIDDFVTIPGSAFESGDVEGIITETAYNDFGYQDTIGYRPILRKTEDTTYSMETGNIARNTFYHYYNDSTGNLEYSENIVNGVSIRNRFVYDTYGNLKEAYDPIGNKTQDIIYDKTHTFPAIIYNALNHAVRMNLYDYRIGSPTEIINANGQKTTFEFDHLGRSKRVFSPDGGETATFYHDTASPRYIRNNTKTGTIDWIKEHTYFDGLGRVIQTLSPGEDDQKVAARFYFDDMGRNYKTKGPFYTTGTGYPKNPSGQYPRSETTYDIFSRPITITSPSEDGNIVTKLRYSGFSITSTDPDGNLKTERKDFAGRIIQIEEYTDRGKAYTRYGYNAAGDLLKVIDAVGNTTTIEYDIMGRKINMDDPDMGFWDYIYNLNSNLEEQIDFKGQTISFTYDILNRLKTKNYSTGEPQVVYEYDTAVNGIGQLYSVSNTNVTSIINQYDNIGRLKSITKLIQGGQPEGYTTTSNYDYAGRITDITYPDQTPGNNSDNLKIEYTFIPGTSLVSQAKTGVTVYATCTSYEPTGKIGQIDFKNGSETVYTYDQLSTRLTGIQIAPPAGIPDTINDLVYTYSKAGDIIRIDHINATGPNDIFTYTYDKLHRLLKEKKNGAPVGSAADQMTYEYNDKNHVHAISGVIIGNNSYSYTYDLNGNMLEGPDFTNIVSPGSRTLTYNADNMPTRIEHSNDTEVDILYDAEGVRTKKTVDGTTETYYINTNYEIIDGIDIYYIFLGSLRIAKIENGVIKYLHKDNLGSTTAISDVDGNIVEIGTYQPFGSDRNPGSITNTSRKFTDQEIDFETGLYNYNARLYDPVLGRFITADSVTPGDGFDPQGLDRYAYSRNNPLKYIDPTGHYWSEDGSELLIGPSEEKNAERDDLLTILNNSSPNPIEVGDTERTPPYTNMKIEGIDVDLTTQTYTITWIGEQNVRIKTGPYLSSSGSGKNGRFNCNDTETSQTSGTNCTPKGSFPVLAKIPFFPKYPTSTKNVIITDFYRGVALHYYKNVPRYPASHGCVRIKSLGVSDIMYKISEIGRTIINIDGTWTHPNRLN